MSKPNAHAYLWSADRRTMIDGTPAIRIAYESQRKFRGIKVIHLVPGDLGAIIGRDQFRTACGLMLATHIARPVPLGKLTRSHLLCPGCHGYDMSEAD